MEYMAYQQLMQQAAQLVEMGAYEEAKQKFEQILEQEIALVDKAMICLNLAVVCDKKGDSYSALRWFDEGIRYEKRYHRFFVTVQKANYLQKQGQVQEARQIYHTLIQQPFVSEREKAEFRRQMARLSG